MKSKFLVLVPLLVMALTLSPAYAEKSGRGKRGSRMREHIAECKQCGRKTEHIADLRQELREVDIKIRDHRWEKTQAKLNKFKEQNPDKSVMQTMRGVLHVPRFGSFYARRARSTTRRAPADCASVR